MNTVRDKIEDITQSLAQLNQRQATLRHELADWLALKVLDEAYEKTRAKLMAEYERKYPER